MILYKSCLNTATESNLVSVCAFCSDLHAGVRWMVHESNAALGTSETINSIDIEFQCYIKGKNVVSYTMSMLYPCTYLLKSSSVTTQDTSMHGISPVHHVKT